MTGQRYNSKGHYRTDLKSAVDIAVSKKLSVRPCGPTRTNTDIVLTLYLIETPFSPFANRVDPDQTALVKLPDQGLLCLLMEL